MELREFSVYIAGSYSGSTYDEIEQHIKIARTWAIRVWEIGMYAICPHLNTAHFEEDIHLEQEDYYKAYQRELLKCDAALVLPNSLNSIGTKLEIEKAKANGIPVFQWNDFDQLLDYAFKFIRNENVLEAKGITLMEWDIAMPRLGMLLASQVSNKGNDSWKTRLTAKGCIDKIERHLARRKEGNLISDHGFEHAASIMADAMFLTWFDYKAGQNEKI